MYVIVDNSVGYTTEIGYIEYVAHNACSLKRGKNSDAINKGFDYNDQLNQY